MKRFALIGVGYVAEKHLEAISTMGGEVVIAHDVHTVVGVLDKYFINTKFTTSWTTFIEMLEDISVDYIVVCTPSYMHISHIYNLQRFNIPIICEKPLVLKTEDLELINDNVYTILQLRYSDAVKEIEAIGAVYEPEYRSKVIQVEYYTPRGLWYHRSWKGKQHKSGGLLMNIGVHLFDLVLWKFGANYSDIVLSECNRTNAMGGFYINDIQVLWKLSIERTVMTRRRINGVNLDSSRNLHIDAYQAILDGDGITKESIKPSLELINEYSRIC